MQTLSSASRTCMASASAVECTATVEMPSSLHARSTRSAISPRLAMRILSNILDRSASSAPPCGEGLGVGVVRCGAVVQHGTTPHPDPPPQGGREKVSFDDHQRLAELDR